MGSPVWNWCAQLCWLCRSYSRSEFCFINITRNLNACALTPEDAPEYCMQCCLLWVCVIRGKPFLLKSFSLSSSWAGCPRVAGGVVWSHQTLSQNLCTRARIQQTHDLWREETAHQQRWSIRSVSSKWDERKQSSTGKSWSFFGCRWFNPFIPKLKKYILQMYE